MKFNTEFWNCTLEIAYMGTREQVDFQEAIDEINRATESVVKAIKILAESFDRALKDMKLRLLLYEPAMKGLASLSRQRQDSQAELLNSIVRKALQDWRKK